VTPGLGTPRFLRRRLIVARRQRSDILGRCVVCRPSCTAFLSTERLPSSIALHVHFKDCRVMHETIHRRERHGGILEDFPPVAERLI
jgi:hypothetical protein